MNRSLSVLAVLTAAALPNQAALSVNQTLGTLGAGTVSFSGDTANGANNADTYTSAGANVAANWGNEWVIEFTIADDFVATLTSNSLTGDPDVFLLSGLGTALNGAKQDATEGLGFAFLDGTPPESASFGFLSAGTYYFSIDSFIGFDGALTPGDATFDYDLTLDVFVAPPAPSATDLGILGNESTVFTIDTFGSGIGDTELGLYDAIGTLIETNDDAGPGFQSELSNTPLGAGTYYVAVGEFNTVYEAGFSVTGAGAQGGDFVLNHPNGVTQGALGDGMVAPDVGWFSFQIVPEPGTMSLLALAGLGLLRRRRS